MVLLRYLSTVIGAVLIATGAAQGEDVMKVVGDQVYFRPDKLPDVPSITSVIWKHRTTGGTTVKAIEWDEGEILIPNQRFKDITTVDNKTGQITITNLKVEHSGVYFFEINSKEQQQRFKLTVKERVPKPVIKTEQSTNPDAVYLRCEYSETIIWKNSDGETLKGSKQDPKGEFIIVEKKGIPENFYTCTLDNGVSKETSDPLYERDLFEEDSIVPAIAGAIIGVIISGIIIIPIVLYFCLLSVHKRVNKHCSCIEANLGSLDCFLKKDITEGESTSAPLPADTNGAELKSVTKQVDTDKQSTSAPLPADNELEPLNPETGKADQIRQ